MRVEVVKEGEKELEVVLDNLTLASLLASYLKSDERVEFAAFNQKHPLEEDVLLLVRVREGKAKDVLLEAVSRAISDVKQLKEAMLSLL